MMRPSLKKKLFKKTALAINRSAVDEQIFRPNKYTYATEMENFLKMITEKSPVK